MRPIYLPICWKSLQNVNSGLDFVIENVGRLEQTIYQKYNPKQTGNDRDCRFFSFYSRIIDFMINENRW